MKNKIAHITIACSRTSASWRLPQTLMRSVMFHKDYPVKKLPKMEKFRYASSYNSTVSRT